MSSQNPIFIQQPKVSIIGDIGGTNARFACITDEGNYYHKLEIYACADFDNLSDALVKYIESLGSKLATAVDLNEVCIAIAGPVYNDIINLPNNHWAFSRTKLQRKLGVPVEIINDFTAQTLSLDLLAEDELLWFDDMRPTGQRIRALVGPGTGLGISIQTISGEVLPSEAGHIAFAARTPHQIDILQLLWKRYPRVSIERILSGPGLENLFWANSCIANQENERKAKDIVALAKENDPIAIETINDFFHILACFAGDLALTAWAADGIYLSGGILPKLLDFLDTNKFRNHFQDKGRFSEFCRTVPIALVKAEQPGLLGCVAALQNR